MNESKWISERKKDWMKQGIEIRTNEANQWKKERYEWINERK